MIAIFVSGGLGNQLFQFSLANQLIHKTKKRVVLDISSFSNPRNSYSRTLEILNLALNASLECLSINGQQIEMSYSKSLIKARSLGKFRVIYATLVTLVKYRVLLHPGYFGRTSRVLFLLPITHLVIPNNFSLNWVKIGLNQDLLNSLVKSNLETISFNSDSNCVGVHVRRGDYTLQHSIHKVLSKEYYLNAMNLLCEESPKTNFLIFSDDIEWCKENLTSKQFSLEFVQDSQILSLIEEFLLLSTFNRIIISNSTFSLLAAFLGSEKKEVVYPSTWFKDERPFPFNLPTYWIKK